MLPSLGKVMSTDRRIESMVEKENCSVVEKLQCPVLDTFRAKSLGDLETPHGCMNFVRGF